jgi:hypothetical protein
MFLMHCIRKAAIDETFLQINIVKLTRLTTTGDRKKQAMDPFVRKQLSAPCVGFSEPHDNKVNRIRNRPRAKRQLSQFCDLGRVFVLTHRHALDIP